MLCKFIQPTKCGFNFLNINTNKCILRHHLYKSKCEVYHRPEAKWVTILGKYTEIKEILKKERKQVKGFYGSK